MLNALNLVNPPQWSVADGAGELRWVPGEARASARLGRGKAQYFCEAINKNIVKRGVWGRRRITRKMVL